jgi:LytR cell envelope-related transcriptional attenuator
VQPESGGTAHLSVVRAVLVLAVFLVAVGVLVAVGTRPSVSGDAVATTTTTVVTHTTVPTTTTTTTPHGSVTVLVANATNTSGLAAHYTTALQAGGWDMQTPGDASTTVATSAVYYAAGQQAAAAAIATQLGLKPAAVQPLTAAVPVAGASGNDIVVVVGADLVAAAT